MKKLVLTSLATVGMTLGALAQGSIAMDNSLSAGGLTIDNASTWFSGTFGMQLFELNGTTIPSGINNAATPMAGYTAMSGALAPIQTWTGKTTTSAGVISLGEVQMPNIAPAGGSAVFGLAAWTGNYATWDAAVAAGAKGGVIAFVNDTGNYLATPSPELGTSLDGWTQNLVMTQLSAVPEPSSFALAGLGAAAMLIFRRRK